MMAKKATKSQSSLESSASDQRMVLRKRQRVVSGERERSASSKKLSVKHKKKNDKFEAKKPKKPPTAFFYFLEDFRKEFQVQNPDVKSMRDIGKACGEKWKTMTYEEKVQYYDIATEKRAEFDRAMADYIKRKESGEGQETEDDSEFDEYA
ncbi:high mobility group B protein 14-like isoform X2 [Mangifera indica]|uniref:high mobility group B protein 14-like isoform X2 n=1 Tax=Mangifera indica TaxID=29780 RepID=UPI001CFBFF51|nr:high mobility group B protein 14-like isoform X2 [Mangifera indica]